MGTAIAFKVNCKGNTIETSSTTLDLRIEIKKKVLVLLKVILFFSNISKKCPESRILLETHSLKENRLNKWNAYSLHLHYFGFKGTILTYASKSENAERFRGIKLKLLIFNPKLA